MVPGRRGPVRPHPRVDDAHQQPTTSRTRSTTEVQLFLSAGWGSGTPLATRSVRSAKQLGQPSVGPLADHRGDFGGRSLRKRSVPTNASGDSVHHQWNSWPPAPQCAPVPLAHLVVTWPSSATSSSRRSGSCQHTSGLRFERVLPAAHGHLVQRAARAGGEARPVQEDAGPLHHAGDRLAVLGLRGDAAPLAAARGTASPRE